MLVLKPRPLVVLRSIDQSALQTPQSASDYLETSQSGKVSPIFHLLQKLVEKITSYSKEFQLCTTAF
jgi:hypothetical protein